MNHPTSAREALIAEALGDVAGLMDRAETVAVTLGEARTALVDASSELRRQAAAFEQRIAALSETVKAEVVSHIVRRGLTSLSPGGGGHGEWPLPSRASVGLPRRPLCQRWA